MKKRFLIVTLIIVAIAAIMIAINSKRNEPQTALKDKVVVVINDGPKETDKDGIKRFKEEIAEFNLLYPNIEIKWTARPYSPDSFSTSMAGGTAEDVILVWATEGYIADRGYALDLTEMINQWEDKDKLNLDILKPFVRNGRYYAFPCNGYIMGMCYNKKLFRQAGLDDNAPADWGSFVEYAKKLTDREKGIAGFGIMGKDAQAGWGLLNWIWQAGGDFEKEENGKWKAAFDEPEAIEAMQFLKDLRWKHDVLQTNLLALMDDLRKSFSAGQLGMFFGTNDTVPGLVQYGMKLSDIGMGLLPEGPGGRANQMGGSYFIINPKSTKKVQEAAFKWLTWYSLKMQDPERLGEYGESYRKLNKVWYISALPIFNTSNKELDAVKEEYKDVLVDYPEVWQEAAKYIKPEPPYFCQQLYSEYLSPALQAVLTNKNANPADLMTKAARGFEDRFLKRVK